jgi:hypothetical protein
VLYRLLVVPVVVLSLAAPSQAGLLRKSARPDPAVHVPALVETLKSDRDERARAAAASELDEYDAKAFPDILPALIDALATDPSTSVRSRAAEAIGKVRPITAAAGYALERATADDKSFQVRVSARTALLKYKVLGHMPGTRIEGVVQSGEPPLATGSAIKDIPSGTVLRPTPAPDPSEGPVTAPPLPLVTGPKPLPDSPAAAPKPADPQTGEPPLAEPSKPTPALTGAPPAPAPVIVIPSTPSKDAIAPATPAPPPSSGPALPPPRGG